MPKPDKQDINLKEVLRQVSKTRQSQGKRIADMFGAEKTPQNLREHHGEASYFELI